MAVRAVVDRHITGGKHGQKIHIGNALGIQLRHEPRPVAWLGSLLVPRRHIGRIEGIFIGRHGEEERCALGLGVFLHQGKGSRRREELPLREGRGALVVRQGVGIEEPSLPAQNHLVGGGFSKHQGCEPGTESEKLLAEGKAIRHEV